VPDPTVSTKLYAAEAAARAGVKPSTWRDYYSDGRTPGAVEYGPSKRGERYPRRADGMDMDRGHARPWWLPQSVDGWKRDEQGKCGGRPKKTTD
jgi:hypothetical protein